MRRMLGRWLGWGSVACLLCLGLGVATARAAVVRTGVADRPAVQDTLVDPNNPTTNYDATPLEVTYSNFLSLAPTRRTLLQFDLAGLVDVATASPVRLTVVENHLPAGAAVKLGLYALADGWEENSVTDATRPANSDLLQTITVTASFTGPVRFDSAAVGAYLETQRTGDGKAAFLLQVDGGSGNLGFGGSLLFDDHEGSYDGINGNEPVLIIAPAATATATPTVTATATPTPSLTPTLPATATSSVTPLPLTATPPVTVTPSRTPLPGPTKADVFLPLVER